MCRKGEFNPTFLYSIRQEEQQTTKSVYFSQSMQTKCRTMLKEFKIRQHS